MQSNNLTTKDKITARLPGHQNQDNNMDGIPDKLETRSNQSGLAGGLNDRNGNGIPDNLEGGRTGHRSLHDLNGDGIDDRLERGHGLTGQQGLVGQQGYNQGLTGQQGLVGQQGFAQGGMTDLNRNGIPDQLEQGQGFGFVGSVNAVQSSVVNVREAPVVVERVEKAAVVHEVYKTEEVRQIQPVIEREREQLDVYQVTQPMREREVIATEVREAVLPGQTRAVVVEDNSAFLASRSAPTDFSTREVAATRSQTIENAPIIHETIVHKVIEEVQPVIYKEIDRPVLIKETLPIYERIVEAPQAHHTVLPMRDLGVRTTTTATGFTDLNRDGIPDQLQGGSYQTTGLQSGLTSQGVYSGQQGMVGQQGYQQGMVGQQGFVGQQGMVGGLNDRNGNGIPDNLEGRTGHRSLHDLNGDGIDDRLERGHGLTGQQGTGLVGGLNDRNGNGIPDNLEGGRAGHRSLHDLNGNGVDDRLERGHGLTGQQGLVGQQGYNQGLNQGMVGQQGFVGQQGMGLNQGMVGQQGYQQGSGLISQPQSVGLTSQPTIVQSGNRTGMVGQQGVIGQQGYNQGLTGQQGLVGGLNDRNGNGIPDNLEKRSAHDLNGNGIPDSLERKMGATTLNPNNRL